MMEPRNNHLQYTCTINTDASYLPYDKTGGYGIWISSDFFTIKRAGRFKSEITDPNEAEIKALVNAFMVLEQFIKYNLDRKRENFKRFETVVINCDNQVARSIIKKRYISKRFKKEGKQLLECADRFDKVNPKVIRGHQANYNSRQYVNNWCDMAAKLGHTNFSL